MTEQSASIHWQKRFYTIWIGQAFSMVGSALVRFALIWWLTEKTKSPVVLTTATIAATLPMIGLSPFIGPLIDRWNRRWVMVVSDALIAFLTAGLAIMYALGIAEVWHVYVILFLRSFGDTFQSPAMQASTSLMVPKNQLARVGGMNDTLMGVVNIVSPPLGALLVKTISMQGTLVIDLVTAVLAIGPLLFMRIPQPQSNSKTQRSTSFWAEMGEGLRYVWGWRGLFFMFVVLAVMRFFLAPAFSLLPLMVTEHFGGDALELAWMSSSHGFGFIAGGFMLSLWGGFKRRTYTALAGLIGMGLGSMAFGLIPGNLFGLGLAVMFLRTAMVPLIRGSVMAIFQTYVPPELQGRVFSLLIASISIMAPFGLALGGPIANASGVNTIFILTGIGCLGVAVIWALNPAILNLESEHKAAMIANFVDKAGDRHVTGS